MVYDIGDVIRLKTTIEELGSANDPGTLELVIRKPDNTTTTYVYGTDAEVVRDDTGVYYVDYSIEQSGRYYYRWTSTGQAQASEEDSFDVRNRRVS